MASMKHDLREQVSEWMRTAEIRGTSGVVSLDLETLARRFTTTNHQMKAVLDSLVAEAGSGVHKVSGHLWSYRHVEWEAAQSELTSRGTPRTQKRHDMQVRMKVYEHMMAQAPNTLHPVASVAAATDSLNQSVSGALNWLSRKDFIPIERAYRGTYRRLPGDSPGIPGMEPGDSDPLAEEFAEEQQAYEEAARDRWVPSPEEEAGLAGLPTEPSSVFPPYSGHIDVPNRPNPALLRELMDHPGAWDPNADPNPVHPRDREPGSYGLMQTMQPAMRPVPGIPEEWDDPARMLYLFPPSRSGTILAEDAKGDVYEVIPLRRGS